MTRHTSLSALRTCRPLFASTSNGYAAMSSLTSVSSSTGLNTFSCGLSRRPFAVPSRQLHFSPTQACLSSAPQPQQQPESDPQPPSPATTSQPSSDNLNPPAITRPPPLDLPVRQPDTTTFHHLYNTGKAYLTFYKTGLKQIWTMHKLVRANPPPPPNTRSTILLRQRYSHDIRRLPLFAVLLLVCGEFTPFVVLFMPQAVPFTCRIPKQVRKLRVAAQERRRAARAEAESAVDAAARERVGPMLQARMLGLVSGVWDRVGGVPTGLVESRVEDRLRFLARDDEMIVKGGGVQALEDDEVVMACVDRGIDTVDRINEELRRVLGRWLSITTTDGLGEDERKRVIAQLVMDGEQNWPKEH
jgi:hypothetical protein